MCIGQSAEVALIIDITWDIISMNLINFLRSTNIPYVHVDVTIRPFVRAFFKYMKYIDSRDVAMIFENEKGKTQLKKFIRKYII